MAIESIIARYKRPGFPKTTNNEKSYRTTLEYIGPQLELEAEQPAVNVSWGSFDGLVVSSDVTPIEGTDYAVMTVICEYYYSQSDSGGGTGLATETTYEIEWVEFSRSMYEHPKFRIGGGGTYELDSDDVARIELWKNEQNADLRGDYKVTNDGTEVDLSTNAKMFCRGLELAQENYSDFAPVVRVTTTYVGGSPSGSDAGEKDNPPTAAGGPSGYEWRKSADRSLRKGGQTRFDRVEEWVGAIKVLSDRDDIFWTAP